MTNYDMIKNMSKNEMAAVFYLFIHPFIEDASKEEKEKVKKHIHTFLENEVKK